MFLARSQLLPTASSAVAASAPPVAGRGRGVAERVLGIREMQREIVKYI